MEHKKEEQLIYLKDLLFAPLHQWKALFAAALIFAVLFGGFMGLSSWNARKNAQALQADPSQVTATEKYQAEIKHLDAELEQLKQNLETRKLYVQESLLMQLDPYSHYEATITLTVNTDYQIDPAISLQNPDKTDLVTSSYNLLALNNQVLEKMATAVNSEPQHIRELIFSSNPNSSTLQVRIKYMDEDGALLLSDIMAQHLKGSQTLITSATVAHTVNVLTQDVTLTIDPDLETTQQVARDSLTLTETALVDVRTQKNNLINPTVYVASASDVVKRAVIFAVLGSVLGVLLAIFISWAMHITSNKVYSAKTLTNRTGVKVLGSISCAGNALDRLINKAEGRNVNDIHVQAKLLALNIRNRCADTKQLLIISDIEDPSKATLVEALRNTLTGVHIDDCKSLLQDPSALEALASCDAVLMIRQCHHSLYSATEQECQIITDSGKYLLGCVLLGG